MSDKNIKLFDVKWATRSGGPSPDDNNRTEIYFMGCKKAAAGNACDGCYNPTLWESRLGAKTYTPLEIAEQVEKFAPNKFVTIVGGEPTDQLEGLSELCRLLKEKGFHIIVFSWKTLEHMFTDNNGWTYAKLLQNIDILVDGEYDKHQRIYQEDADDGFLNTIGSANQTIWDIRGWYRLESQECVNGNKAGDLVGFYVCPNGDLRYITKYNAISKTVQASMRGVA